MNSKLKAAVTVSFLVAAALMSHTSPVLAAGPFGGPPGSFKKVPTPALLPGLIGLGVAAMRKRNANATKTDA